MDQQPLHGGKAETMKRLLTAAIPLLLLFVLLPGVAHAQITSDTATSGSTAGVATSLTISTHTVGGGTNTLLVVGVALRTDNGNSQRISSVTWNGTALTCLVARNDGATVSCGTTGTTTNLRTEIWTLANPASGNHTLVINTNGSNGTTIAAGIQSYANVASVAAGATNGTTSSVTSASVTGITVPTNGVVFDSLAIAKSSTGLAVTGTGDTLLTDISDTSGSGTHIQNGSGQVTGQTTASASWSWSTGSPYAEATSVLTPLSPPTISKAFAPASIGVNGTSTLTLTFSNSNAVALTGVGVVDNLPAGVQVAGTPAASNTCGATFNPAAAATTLTVTGGTVPASGSCTAQVNVTSAAAGTYNNTTNAVTSTNGGTGAVSNTAALAVVIPPTIAKAFGTSPIAQNTSTSLTFTVTNPSATVTQTGVAFTDTFPAGLVVATPNGLSTTCSGTIIATQGTGTVSLSAGSLAASGSCTIAVNVTGTTAGSKTNSVTVSSTNQGTGNTASATIVVVAPPTIAKAFNVASMAVTTGTATLTLTITNPSANTVAESGIAVGDTFPSGMVVASTPNATNSCGGTFTANAGTNNISLTGGSITTPGTTCAVSVSVSDTTSGVASNTTGAVSSTNGGTGLTANATIAVEIPPTITKAFNPTAIATGATSTLTITITNPAANTVALTGVAVTDALPTGLVVATPNGASTTCTGGTESAVAGSGTVSITGASINAGASCNVVANVTSATVGTYNNTTGTVSATNGGTGGTASATLSVAAPPTMTKSFSPTSINTGATSTLTLTITNPAADTGAMNGIAVSDTFPTGMTIAATPNATNTCGGTFTANANAGSMSLTGGSIATPGTTCAVSVSVTSTTAGNSSNTTGTVSSTNDGTGTTANAVLNVVSPPTITKAFGAGAAGMPVGGTTTMTITITDPAANTVAQSGVAVSDTFPTGMTISTAATTTCSGGTLTGGGVGSGTVSLSGASISTSSSCTITASVTDTTAGTATNTTGTVSSTNGGTGLTASANLIVNNPPTVTKTFSPTSVGTGVSSLLTITITNPDTVTLTGVTISDTFPSGLVVQTPNGASTTGCTGGTLTATAGSGSISLSASSVAVGTPCVIKVNVQSPTPNTYVNTTNAVTSTNGGTGLTASATLTVTPIATVTAIAVGGETPGSVGPGSSATYAITTTWTGPGTCTSVPLTINWTPATGETAGFSPTTVSNSSTTTTLTISTTASTPTGSTNFTVTVTSTGGTGQCGTGAVTSSTQTFVVATATINAANVGAQTPNPVIQGSSATFPITSQWSGTGQGCVSNPLTMSGWVPPSPDVTATFNPTTVSSGSPNSTLTITTFADTPPSTTTFQVQVSNNLGGGCSSNNSVITNTAALVVSGNAAPSITKTFTPPNIAPSTNSTLTLVISALAADTSNLTNVSVSDPFPSGMQVASTPAATNSCTAGSTAGTFTAPANATTISYSGASIAPGGTCTLTVNVTASTSGSYVNTTGTVTAGNVSTAGNSATATLTIFGAPTQLVFGTGPSNTGVGSVVTPAVTVQVEDAGGNVVTNSSASITVAIGNEGTGPGNGSLSGTLTIVASSGIATFGNLVINRIGTGYTLVASSSPLTSATSSAFNITQPTDNYTEPFNTGHGWTWTQVTCTTQTLGQTCSPANGGVNNITTAADCQVAPCVSAAYTTNGISSAGTMAGYYHNPSGYTWQTIGVPAGATVNTVSGSWWDLVTSVSPGCGTTVTAGMHIYNSANTTEITSSPVFADTSLLGDSDLGATHGPGTAVNVTAASAASTTAITLRFDLNPSTAGSLFNGTPTCTIYGDSFNLLITYTPPTGGRRGQVIIGFNRMPNGDFQMTKPVLVSSTQDGAEGRAASANPAMLSKRTE
jgi:hypothetical protein